MTTIPLENLIPLVFSLFHVTLSQLVCFVTVGVMFDVCTGIDSARDSRFRLASRENGCGHDAESIDQHFTWKQVTVKPLLKMQVMG